MDRTERVEYYREVIKSVLREYARLFNGQPEGVDVIAVCDDDTNTYTVINIGWYNNHKQRMNITSVLLRIVNGKIWLEEDNTTYQFVEELLDQGIQKDEIGCRIRDRKVARSHSCKVVRPDCQKSAHHPPACPCGSSSCPVYNFVG